MIEMTVTSIVFLAFVVVTIAKGVRIIPRVKNGSCSVWGSTA